MSALEPGLYRATVRGVPDVVVMFDDGGLGSTIEGVGAAGFDPHGHGSSNITDARPLIVLDLNDNDARHLVSYLQIIVENHPEILGVVGRDVFTAAADQIEAQTKPARIPEPGLWGVVEAVFSLLERCTWVHDEYGWRRHDGLHAEWDDLINPTLIRDGIES